MTQHINRRVFLAGLGAIGASATLPSWGEDAPSGMPAVKGLSPAAPSSVGMNDNLSEAISAFMKQMMDAKRLTGGVTAVARKNKLVHFASYGLLDLDAKSPMTTDRLFVMMSSTKPITGVALLQQIEEGKVKLEDPIAKFIPELKNMKVNPAGGGRGARGPVDPATLVPANREITIKDLATHTSGLNGSVRGVTGPNTLENRIPKLASVALDFQPGTRWAYSATTGPDVLARVVEICSGMPYDKYLKERIFDPIGMVDTGHNLTDEQRARVVPRYTLRNDAWQRAGGEPRATTYFAGSFGLSASTQDYLLFESMLLNKGTALTGKRVLKPESVELMHTNLIGDLYHGLDGTTKGTGFGVLVRTVLDTSTCGCGRAKGGFGWGGAYGTMSWTDPQNELVAVFMVQQSGIREEFEKVVQGAIKA